jgi:YfiH family protein
MEWIQNFKMDLIIPNWPAAKNIKAISSTRNGGLSIGKYSSLNLGIHVGDDESNVKMNRAKLVNYAKMPSQPVWLNQTHSTYVTEVKQSTSAILEGDGLFTKQQGVVCSVMTADCLPVLLANAKGTQVSAVHAGWRGLSAGIIENAVKKFDGEVIAWVGPSIGATSFEVGKDVFDAFVRGDSAAVHAFVKINHNKWLADMNILVTQKLNFSGVTNISYSGCCTFSEPQRFFSYRRDGVTGRLATFIWIER